jgi:hypothetical protein
MRSDGFSTTATPGAAVTPGAAAIGNAIGKANGKANGKAIAVSYHPTVRANNHGDRWACKVGLSDQNGRAPDADLVQVQFNNATQSRPVVHLLVHTDRAADIVSIVHSILRFRGHAILPSGCFGCDWFRTNPREVADIVHDAVGADYGFSGALTIDWTAPAIAWPAAAPAAEVLGEPASLPVLAPEKRAAAPSLPPASDDSFLKFIEDEYERRSGMHAYDFGQRTWDIARAFASRSGDASFGTDRCRRLLEHRVHNVLCDARDDRTVLVPKSRYEPVRRFVRERMDESKGTDISRTATLDAFDDWLCRNGIGCGMTPKELELALDSAMGARAVIGFYQNRGLRIGAWSHCGA